MVAQINAFLVRQATACQIRRGFDTSLTRIGFLQTLQLRLIALSQVALNMVSCPG